MIRRRALAFVSVAMLALTPLRVFAVEWNALTDGQRQVLQNYRAQWSDLPADQQQRLALGAS